MDRSPAESDRAAPGPWRVLGRQLVLGAIVLSLLTYAASSVSGPDRMRTEVLALVRARPQVLLVGNSLIRMGIDEQLLGERIGRRVSKCTSDGSGTAFWTAVVRHAVPALQEPPQVVVFLIRDFEVVDPTMGMRESSSFDVRALAGEDPLLYERASVAALGRTRAFLQKAWPPARVRDVARDAYERVVRNQVAGRLVGSTPRQMTLAFARVLGDKAMRKDLLERFQGQDFEEQVAAREFGPSVEDSLLPVLLDELAELGSIGLFVRSPRPELARGHAREPGRERFLRDFAAYVEARGARSLDLSLLPGIRPEHFVAGDHLGKDGAAILTEAVAQALLESAAR